MSRAAPGVFARGKLRRNLPEYYKESVEIRDGCWSKCPYWQAMEIGFHPFAEGTTKCGSFTLHFSDYGVGCGRLGEVVSLVGDCRPPPPGNPHRPTIVSTPYIQADKTEVSSFRKKRGNNYFSSRMQDSWRDFSSLCVRSTFNSIVQNRILKILNSIEYFKVNCSSFYCTWKKPVLEFVHLHSYLCGSLGVKPLSIAITNVLGMQE